MALYILNENLEVLICKNIKSLPSIEYPVQQFQRLYNYDKRPVINYNDIWIFVHIRRDSLVFLFILDRLDSCLMETLAYLDQFYELLKDYLNIKKLDRKIILDNTTLVMELIDESCDYGVVQVTDSGIMKDYIRIKVNIPGLATEILRENKNKNNKGSINVDNCSCSSSSSSSSDIENDGGKKKKKSKRKHRHTCPHVKSDNVDNNSADNNSNNNNGGGIYRNQELEKITKNIVGTIPSDPLELIDKSKKIKSKYGIRSLWRKDTKGAAVEEDLDNFMNSDIAKTTIMAVSWRTKGIHYSKNEFFLDVIESVEYLMDFTNNVIKNNSIHGEIICKSFLSGMPNLKISINKILDKDPQFLSNCKFHQCVSIESIEDGKEIEFIPPDGPFTLCKYDLKRHVRDEPLIKLTSFQITPKWKKYKLKLSLTIESHFKTTNSTTKLNIKIPIKYLLVEYSIDLSKNLKFKCDIGRILFNVSDNILLWEVDTIKGGHGKTQLSMAVEFTLFNREEYLRQQEELKTSMNPPPLREGPKLEELYKQIHGQDLIETDVVEGAKDRGDLSVVKQQSRIQQTIEDKDRRLKISFEVPYLTASGLKIEYLKIQESQLQYQSLPWVRYKIVSDPEYTYLVY